MSDKRYGMGRERQDRPRLGVSRLVLNIAILVGGGIGFVVQNQIGMTNEEAFILVGGFALGAVALANFAWLFNERVLKNRSK